MILEIIFRRSSNNVDNDVEKIAVGGIYLRENIQKMFLHIHKFHFLFANESPYRE